MPDRRPDSRISSKIKDIAKMIRSILTPEEIKLLVKILKAEHLPK